MKTRRIGMFSGLLVLMFILVGSACASAQEDLPWSNETDVIIFPMPPLPPIFSNFSITPTEIQIGDDIIISFVIENINNRSITWMSTTRIGNFFTQIIEIELDAYESKLIWFRIIPNETDPVIIVTDWQRVDGILVDVDDTERDLINVLLSLENVYAEMLVHDSVLMQTRFDLRVLESLSYEADEHIISDQIQEREARFALEERVTEYEVETEMSVEQLEHELYVLNREFEHQRTISFAGIGIAIFLLLGLFVIFGRRPSYA